MTIAILLLAAAFAGPVSAIDNCCYVDRECTTELDWIGGWHAYQNNQCSAPAGSGAARGASAQIDNCCQVDRHCTTELDWIGGWHAFRNGQCQAPTQSQTPAISQPTGGAAAQVDNCCQVDRHCVTELDWIGGWHAYRDNQCGAYGQAHTVASSQRASGVLQRTATGIVIGYTSGHRMLPSTQHQPSIEVPLGEIVSMSFNNCCQYHWQCNSDSDWRQGYHTFQTTSLCTIPGVVSIVADTDFIEFFTQRLDELKNKLPQRYDYVLNGLDKVEQRSHGKQSHVSPGLRIFFTVGRDARPAHIGRWAIQRAAVLVHEACHVYRYDAGLEPGGLEAERECLTREIEAMEVYSPNHPRLSWMRHVLANIENPEYQWWHG